MAAQTRGSLKRNLGLWAIVGLGLGYMTPTVVYDTFGIVSAENHGAVPSSYLVALVVMAFTAISYGKMVRAFPAAGSSYTYARESIHPNVGFMVGWVALLDYLLLPLVNILIMRLYMEYVFPDVPAWMFVVLFTIIVTGSVAISMTGTSRFNSVLLAYSLTVMIVFTVLIAMQVTNGAGVGSLMSGQPFVGNNLDPATIISGATLVCFSFIGFDAVTMYAEEAKDQRIMPRAILLTVLLGGSIFLIGSYFAQLRWPSNEALIHELQNPALGVSDPEGTVEDPLTALGHIAGMDAFGEPGGTIFMFIFMFAGFAATMASCLSSHASVSRMLLVMGRNGVLPKRVFGYVNPKTHTPVYNVILVGAVAVLPVIPQLSLDFVTSVINFGALIAFTFVNLSVIAWYAVRQGRRKTAADIFNYIVMPVAATAMTVLLWVNLNNNSLIIGGAWAIIGFIYLLFITKGFKLQPRGFDENTQSIKQIIS